MCITRRVLDQYDKEDGDLCDVECVQVIVIKRYLWVSYNFWCG